ncbi:MAG: FHA domain-containing protein [Leucobacter sp.]|nr:FHA domain-containing protein [Leucobacter sp.]
MRLKLSVVFGTSSRDVELSCDVTATIRDVAQLLICSGASSGASTDASAWASTGAIALGDAARAHGELTLLAGPDPGEGRRVLDPAATLGTSGLRSGWYAEVVPEFAATAARLVAVRGTVEVLSGTQAGARFSLIAGANTIGRDERSRIRLEDRSVSRRHADVEVGERIVMRDAGSANGIASSGTRHRALDIESATEVRLGEIVLRITPVAGDAVAPPVLDHRHLHTRAPRVDAPVPVEHQELPSPPCAPTANRFPLVAMLAPAVMGAGLFAMTGSSMSLVMAAFTPLMMVGSWVDHAVAGKRRWRSESRAFARTLAGERARLVESRRREECLRRVETPSLDGIAAEVLARGRLLWARRPDQRFFLSVGLGMGVLPSRTVLDQPARGDAEPAHWAQVQALVDEFRDVGPVPVVEHFGRCGSIGIAGAGETAAGLVRAILVQLAGLHSPADLTIAAVTGDESVGAEWEWLKWLPHVDPIDGPLGVRQLARTPEATLRLLLAAESLISARSAGRGPRVRPAAPAGAPDGDPGSDGDAPPLPIVMVVVLDRGIADDHRARLIGIAEDGPAAGVHVIWLADRIDRLPAACRTFVESGDPAAGVHRVGFVRGGTTVVLDRIEGIGREDAAALARSLASVEDAAVRALDESDLPRSVDLAALHDADLLGGAASILQSWRAGGSIVSEWREGAAREPLPIAAIIGQAASGPVRIDLRAHGPHALVGGTTGSGKSEFLQSWIMSLAANLSPERLTFLLIDYKGGAAFAECVDLPHTVGLVTDLSPHFVRRALASLRAELRYREKVLNEHGAKDLLAMEQRGDPAAPPVLVVVIDELAALAADVPEFIAGIIDVAQRGRSLGLHLIMATQRPAGVITDNLRANTNLRVALRMADESESRDVIGVKDAAGFDIGTPGRAALASGAGSAVQFQAGYLGGRAGDTGPAPRIELRSLVFGDGEALEIAHAGSARHGRAAPKAARDIERVRDAVVAAAREAGLAPPRRPWLDPLPELLALEEVRAAVASTGRREERTGLGASGRAPGVVIGMRDRPDRQAQEAVELELDRVGTIALIGASGTGKTSALLTIAAALGACARSDPAHLYAIDAAGGGLESLRALPTVGAVAPVGDDELVRRILRHVRACVADRSARFAASAASDLDGYRRTTGTGEPRIVLLIDGFSVFREAVEHAATEDAPLRLLEEIMRAGRSVGVHVVLTADRPGALPAPLAANVQRRLVLRLASAQDYVHADVPGEALVTAPPGRAIISGDGHEVQLAVVGGSSDRAEQVRALERLGDRLRAAALAPAPVIRNAPACVGLQELPAEAAGRPVFGIEVRDLESIGMPVSGLGVVAGPAGSGLSTAVLACADAVSRWAELRGEDVERVLLSLVPERANGLAKRAAWDRVAHGAREVAELARELTAALGAPVNPAAVADACAEDGWGSEAVAGGGAPERPVFSVAAAHGVVVVERPTDAEGTEALPALVALAKAARRADVLVLFEFETGAASAAWDLLAAVKQPRWGVALQPDAEDGGSPFREGFGRVRRRDFPPGRGFALEAGRVTPIQVAWPDRAPE